MKKIIVRVKNYFKTMNFRALTKKNLRSPIFWVRFSAVAIPIIFLLYVLYVNYLPFGYSKDFIIDVGGPNDTDVSEFYLEPSDTISDRKITEDGTTYREMNRLAYAIFKPNISIEKNAEVTISITGKDIFIIPPIVNFDPNLENCEYYWDFSDLANQGKTEIGRELKGNPIILDNSAYFNGKDTRLSLPESSNEFENGPFSIYIEWDPRDSKKDNQSIIGHYNWRIVQNKKTLSFIINKVNDEEGKSYIIKYDINSDFFNKKHSALAIYNPLENGYIEFYVDNSLIERRYMGKDKIFENYGDKDLLLGISGHGKANYFKGFLHKLCIIKKNILIPEEKIIFKISKNNIIYIPIISEKNSMLNEIKLNVKQ